MIQDRVTIAVSFSGEISEMLDGNEHLHYVVPSKGSNLWFDNMVIPKSANNIDGAYAFMSFMLRPENALRNAEYVGYSSNSCRLRLCWMKKHKVMKLSILLRKR